MAAAALLSSVMSNVPVTVLFLGLAQPVLKAVGAKPGSSRLGKCLMIGIPFAAVNGGMATPAGSSFNVLAMGVFESIAGKPLTFIQTRGHKRRMLGINKRRSRKCRQNFGL